MTRTIAAQTEWGRPLVDSTFTLALVTGLSVSDVSQHTVNLGWDEVKLPHPVFEGDTLYAQTEVLDKRESKSRPNMGIVWLKNDRFQPAWRGSYRDEADDHGLQADTSRTFRGLYL